MQPVRMSANRPDVNQSAPPPCFRCFALNSVMVQPRADSGVEQQQTQSVLLVPAFCQASFARDDDRGKPTHRKKAVQPPEKRRQEVVQSELPTRDRPLTGQLVANPPGYHADLVKEELAFHDETG